MISALNNSKMDFKLEDRHDSSVWRTKIGTMMYTKWKVKKLSLYSYLNVLLFYYSDYMKLCLSTVYNAPIFIQGWLQI